MKPLQVTSRSLGVVLVVAASHCRREAAPPAGDCPPCHAPFFRDAERERDIRQQWSELAPKFASVRELDIHCLCFGEGPSVFVEGGSAYLASQWALAEQTARAAHLGLHRKQPPWDERSKQPCDERVERAVAAEVAGHALELDVRHELGVTSSRYPFEGDYFALPSAARPEFLRAYFANHPDGDGVVPGFVVQYRARCLAPRTQ